MSHPFYRLALSFTVVLAGLLAAAAQAAVLGVTVAGDSFQPRPRVQVTVSGVEVFNAVTQGFTIPVNTTGQVVVRIAALPDYQEFTGWGGVCAGRLPSLPCEFDAGQNVGYAVGIGVRSRTGTLRFTASSGDSVAAPLRMEVDQVVAPDGGLGLRSVSTQANATPVLALAGAYAFEPRARTDGACEQSPVLARHAATVVEGQETVVPVAFQTDRCAVTAEVPLPYDGAVTSVPAGVDCPLGTVDPVTGSACAGMFPFRSTVRLTARPNAGFAFAGWDGCSPKLDRVCTATAVPGSAKRANFVVAGAGSADLALVATDLVATDAGAGRVRLSLTLRNLGSSAAAGVRAEWAPTVPAPFSEIPSIVSDGGSCNALFACTWALGELAAGAARTVTFTAASARGDWPSRACTLSSTPDPDHGNDCVSATPALGVVTPPGPATVAFGPATPAAGAALKGEIEVPALQFTVTPAAGSSAAYALTGITLAASGTGQDSVDLTVRLYPDDNGNGRVDAAERTLIVASGRFDGDDGVLRVDFPPNAIAAGRRYLLAVDVSTTLAAAAPAVGFAAFAGLALCGGALGSRRRRWALLAVAAAVALVETACGGGGGSTAPVIRTYRLVLTDVRVQADTQAVGATGVPLAGAELSVQR